MIGPGRSAGLGALSGRAGLSEAVGGEADGAGAA